MTAKETNQIKRVNATNQMHQQNLADIKMQFNDVLGGYSNWFKKVISETILMFEDIIVKILW